MVPVMMIAMVVAVPVAFVIVPSVVIAVVMAMTPISARIRRPLPHSRSPHVAASVPSPIAVDPHIARPRHPWTRLIPHRRRRRPPKLHAKAHLRRHRNRHCCCQCRTAHNSLPNRSFGHVVLHSRQGSGEMPDTCSVFYRTLGCPFCFGGKAIFCATKAVPNPAHSGQLLHFPWP